MIKTAFSFANWRYYKSQDFLNKSLEKRVDQIYSFRENDLAANYYEKLANHFRPGRGFGYWVWKSELISRLLTTAEDKEIFFYIDTGNECISDDIEKIYEKCANDEKGIILFDNRDGEPSGNIWTNNQWTKSDCFNLMGLTNKKYIYGNQVDAAYICFRKTDFSLKFFDAFKKCSEIYSIISDAPNTVQPLINNGFCDQRHDKSILSLLSIRYNITILREPSQYGNHLINKKDDYDQIFDHHRKNYYIH